MIKTNFIVLISLGLALVGNAQQDTVFNRLVWSDEFNRFGPIDTAKWFHQTLLPNGSSWFNGEVQHYTDRSENSFMQFGNLHIVAKRESFTDQNVTKEFTSARLNSKFAFTYGRVAVRAKMPIGYGTWPAIWMLGKNIDENGGYWDNEGFGTTPWPACGEIDIMEHWGTNQNYVSSAIHTPSSFGGTINHGGRVIPTVSSDFHVYEMVWTPEEIIFSVDSIIHYTYNPAVKNADTWPFYDEQYLLLNIAIEPSISGGFQESDMVVDYVRVYQGGKDSTGTGIADGISNDPLVVYPNPAENEIRISGLPTDTKVEIALYNVYGQCQKHLVAKVLQDEDYLMQIGELSKGCYFLSVSFNETTQNHTFIKTSS